MRPSSAGGNTFSSGAAKRLGDALHVRHQLGVLAHVGNQIGADVGGQQNDCVLEIDEPPFAVLHPTLVEYLEEDFVDIRMGLLNFVQQND